MIGQEESKKSKSGSEKLWNISTQKMPEILIQKVLELLMLKKNKDTLTVFALVQPLPTNKKPESENIDPDNADPENMEDVDLKSTENMENMEETYNSQGPGAEDNKLIFFTPKAKQQQEDTQETVSPKDTHKLIIF